MLAGPGARDSRHTCFDTGDRPLFYVERYAAVDHPAFMAFSPDGQPLATFLFDTGVGAGVVELRDGTGASLAQLRKDHGKLEITETGGRVLGFCWRDDVATGAVFEDHWGLTVFEEPAELDRLGLVALPLACRLLFPRSPGPRPGAYGEMMNAAPLDLASGVELAADAIDTLLS